MHRPGCDPENMRFGDFLCDFCERAWDGVSPMVEGHEGSLICGTCLTTACRAVLLGEGETVGPGMRCTMCLEERAQKEWASPVRPRKVICERCIRQAAQSLEKDRDTGWTRPT